MKKLLKRIASLLVCGAVFLTGCGAASTSLPGELKAPNTDYPDTVNILAPDFFMSSAKNSDQVKQQWLDEMSQRYGVKFNIISNDITDPDNPDTSASDEVFAVWEGTTTFKGLFPISGFGSNNSSLCTALDNDVIVPLEDYLADNSVWNALPDDFKSLFEVDGHIYAIPTSVSQTQCARIIHNEALEEVGITVTDLDSFHDFAVAYAQKTGNSVISSTDVGEMTDILNAFGLYPGDQSISFGYDPTEDCYVDWLTKSAAVDALEYLRELYKSGAIYLSYNKDYSKFTSGSVASIYDQNYDSENCTEVLTLNPEYPQIAYTIRHGFAMTKDTPQPKETINLLVNMLFECEDNYLECWLGSSDNYTMNSDGTITIKMQQDFDGNYVSPCIPGLVDGLPDIFPYSDVDIYYSQNGVIDMELKTDAGKTNARLKQQYDSVKNGSVVEIPLLFQNMRSATYDANKSDIYKLYTKCFRDAIISKDKTVQQVVDEYKEAMLNMGGNFMLDEMNAAIGKKTAYYYG